MFSAECPTRGVSYFLFRQKVGKNHATRSLWQNPFNCPFPGRRSQSASLRRYLASQCVLALRRAPFIRPVNGQGDFATFATVAVRGASWLLQRPPCSRAIIGYELLIFYSQLCQAWGSGARRPLMRERGKGFLRAEGNRCRVPHALRP